MAKGAARINVNSGDTNQLVNRVNGCCKIEYQTRFFVKVTDFDPSALSMPSILLAQYLVYTRLPDRNVL